MAFSVVILSKHASNLVPCVGAVRAMEPELLMSRIVVVDDGAKAEAESELPGIFWTQGEKPFIFSRNANRGIQVSAPDDIILLNDDALLQTRGGFSALRRASEAHPEYGLIASTCNNVGNSNQWPLQGGGIPGAGIRGGLLDGLRDEPRMVCFVCVYIPRRTIETVGLLDERFVGYGMEDDDYSFRVRNAGLKIGISDACFVDHGRLNSSFRGSWSGRPSADFTGNLKIFIEKWGHDNRGLTKEQSPHQRMFA